jgi:hypothetical protein
VVYFLLSPHLEDKVAIRQLIAQGAELVRHALHFAAVVADAKITLPESTKLFIKLKDMRLTDPKELSLDSKPRPSSCLRGFANNFLQLNGEVVEHPRQHYPIVVVPIHSVVDLVSENMVIKCVADQSSMEAGDHSSISGEDDIIGRGHCVVGFGRRRLLGSE